MEPYGFEKVDMIESSSIRSVLSLEQEQHWIQQGEYDRIIQRN
ncbi:hypothetical protein J2Z69_003312 [Paenibacillus shirakamiensis]|uniref:Uncharacterized protein n=1 Tax=Paenibacillus shirakamiensis TaxID=1265935 RepID=A0ABS4JMA1_9BACL|nr:hypothetical protein [Paenibacillus shirakamiensis]MBP2002240.1 hypothetical protein [Paenibacillus shirakamiensis]